MTTKITKTVAMIVATMSLMAPAVSHSVEILPATVALEAYPGDIAISSNDFGKLIIRSFPKLLSIYVYDGDDIAESNCYAGCVGAWSPVLATYQSVNAVGYWSQIVRKDNTRQWAYKGHPIYTYFADYSDRVSSDNQAIGDNQATGKWHVLQIDDSTKVANASLDN